MICKDFVELDGSVGDVLFPSLFEHLRPTGPHPAAVSTLGSEKWGPDGVTETDPGLQRESSRIQNS